MTGESFGIRDLVTAYDDCINEQIRIAHGRELDDLLEQKLDAKRRLHKALSALARNAGGGDRVSRA